MDKEISVNIIGSGLGGLFCGAILAKHGFKVNIFEARLKIGGYASSWKRKDYLFDSSLHELNGFIPDDRKLRTFRFLGLFERIKLVKIRSSYTSVFNDYEFMVPHDFEALQSKLTAEFPEEGENIRQVMRTIKNLSVESTGYLKEKSKFQAIIRTPLKYPHLMLYLFKTVYNYIWKKIRNERLRTIMTQMISYYSHDVKKSNLIYFASPTYYFLNQAFWISGTSGTLSNALKNIIEENEGRVYTHKKVTGINFRNKKAVSITVNGKEEYESDITICNSPLKYTVEKLIGKKEIPLLLRKKAMSTVPSTSLFSIYLGMNIDVKKLGVNEFCYMLNEVDDINKVNTNGSLIDYSQRPIVLAAFNLDGSLCPAGKTVLNACVLDNTLHWNKFKDDKAEYKKEKERVAGIILDRIEKRFPGFKKHIDVMETGTPVTMEKYSNNTDGAVYGACQTVFQGNIFRFPNEVKGKNLYFASAWVSPGGGFSGTIISAIVAAERILKKYKIKNRLDDFVEPFPASIEEITGESKN